MHSFHRSRGRILFEVLCALAISASCVGAWMQTGAWALLPAGFAALLYGFVHALDLARRNTSAAVDQPESEGATGSPDDLPAPQDAAVLEAPAGQEVESVDAIEVLEQVEPAPPRKSRGRGNKTPRKGAGRRASAPKEVNATEPEPAADIDAAMPVPTEEVEIALPTPFEEGSHTPLAPLFEPEPFVRHQRAVFGRKAG